MKKLVIRYYYVLKNALNWIFKDKKHEWLFSGIGTYITQLIITFIIAIFGWMFLTNKIQIPESNHDINDCFTHSDTCKLNIQNIISKLDKKLILKKLSPIYIVR